MERMSSISWSKVYVRALERLGLKYQYQRFGLRNTVERFFGYLKQRTRRFYINITHR
jgi:transposase-like protein